MEDSKVICSKCKQRSTTLATVFCQECTCILCSKCQKHHHKQMSSKGHTLISLEDHQKLPTFVRNVQLTCKVHNGKYQHYCMTHERPLCMKCLKESHKKCSEVKVLDDVVRNVKTSFALERSTSEIKLALSNLKNAATDRKDNINRITKDKHHIISKIKKTRIELNKRLDQLQEKMLRGLNNIYMDTLTPIQELLKSVETKEESLRELDMQIPTIKTYASNFQTFIGLKQIETKIQDCQNYLTNLIEKNNLDRIKLTFNIDNTIRKCIDNIQSYGNIEISREMTACTVEDPKLKEAQLVVNRIESELSKSNLNYSHEFRLPSGNFRGCCTLSNGNIVLADFTPGKTHIEEYDFKKSLISSISLEGVYDVVAIDNFKVVASDYVNKKFMIIDMKSKKILHTAGNIPSPSGITYKDNKIIFCATYKGIKSYNLEGNHTEHLYADVAVDMDSHIVVLRDRMCYTCPFENSVTVLDSKHKLLFKFRDDNLLRDPRGIAVDHQKNIYVGGHNSHNVVVISPDGKKTRELINKETTRLNGPLALHSDINSKRLLVIDSDCVIRFYTFG